MAIAEESVFIVERLNVITMGKLSKDFTAGYERMVEAIYYQENRWSGGLYRADTEDMEQLTNEEEFDVDTLTELADAVIKKTNTLGVYYGKKERSQFGTLHRQQGVPCKN